MILKHIKIEVIFSFYSPIDRNMYENAWKKVKIVNHFVKDFSVRLACTTFGYIPWPHPYLWSILLVFTDL